MYKIAYTKIALKHIPYLKAANLDKKTQSLIALIKNNPYQTPPSYEKLTGDLSSLYSRRINAKHRLVYMIDENLKIIKILSMWTHCET